MRLCLVEDRGAAALEPLTLTRATFDLILGATAIGSKIARAFKVGPGPARRGALVRTMLAEVMRTRDPHLTVNDRDWLARGNVLVANGRWVPPGDLEGSDSLAGPSWVGTCEGRPACAWVGPGDVARSGAERRRRLVRGPGGSRGMPRRRGRVDRPAVGHRRQERRSTSSATSTPRARSA